MSDEGIAPDPRDPAFWRERAEQAEAACAELARRLTNQIEAGEQAEALRQIESAWALLLQAKYDAARRENAFLREWLSSALTIANADIDAALADVTRLTTTPADAGTPAEQARARRWTDLGRES